MKKYTKYIIGGILLAAVLVGGSAKLRQQRIQLQLAQKVLRFHVLANSDTDEDQMLKLAVRDAIGGYMQENMQSVNSKEECENFIINDMEKIKNTAKQVVTEAGYDYEVTAELSQCEFPVKTYGDYTFPAGCYDALKITIGEGNGRNWWCVMYPNMCFENSMYEVVDEKSKEQLRAVLDEEEYEAVLNSKDYEVRFWLLEIFK